MTGGMMFKGTPGPWECEGRGRVMTADEEFRFIGEAHVYEDAVLMASAPELLEALIRLEKATRILPPHFDEKDSPFYQARAAIAKALGDQK